MDITSKAIVLSALKYSDTSLIVKCFTEKAGVKSYMLKGVLASKKGKLRAGYFQPLTQLEIVASHRNKGTLERINEVKVSYPFRSLYTDVVKNSIVFFLSEVLSHALQEEEENIPLFSFIENASQWLDTHHDVANFHLFFLIKLSRYLGFHPSEIDNDAPFFDLLDSEYAYSAPLHPYLSENKLNLFNTLLKADFDSVTAIKTNKGSRNDLTGAILQYYEFHLDGFKQPRSLEILSQIFN